MQITTGTTLALYDGLRPLHDLLIDVTRLPIPFPLPPRRRRRNFSKRRRDRRRTDRARRFTGASIRRQPRRWIEHSRDSMRGAARKADALSCFSLPAQPSPARAMALTALALLGIAGCGREVDQR